MSLEKFKKELDEVTDPAIKKVGEYLLTRKDIHDNLNKENKSLNEMFAYIVSQANEEVYGMAIHYYDEDNIKVNQIKERVKVETNKDVKKEVEEEPKKEDLVVVEVKEVKKKVKKDPKKKDVDDNQMSLFDLLGE